MSLGRARGPTPTPGLHRGGRFRPRSATCARSQRGIALVTVLLVLVAVLVLSVGTIVLTSSSLMIAENQVSAAVARAHAESGIDATVALLFETFRQTGELPSSPPPPPRVTGLAADVEFLPAPSRDGVPWYSLVREDTVRLRILGLGPRNAEYLAEALVEFGGSGGGPSPFRGSVVACENVLLSGSGRIDSFDSRLDRYDPRNPTFSGHVLNLGEEGIVQIVGNAPIYGDVTSAGGVRATGSSTVYGDIYANGLVDLAAGGGTYPGNVRTTGDVRFSSSSVVHGSVYANGSIEFRNYAARAMGDARAGGDIVKARSAPSISHHVKGQARAHDDPNIPRVPSEECDPLHVLEVVQGFDSLPSLGSLRPDYWPYKEWVLTPGRVKREHAQTGELEDTEFTGRDAVVLGRDAKVIVLSGLDLTRGDFTRVTGGDVVLVVRGDFTAGGNHKVYIDEGSSLTVFVTGRVNLGGSFAVLDGSDPRLPARPVTADGRPTFAIYSSFTGSQGVRLSGNGKLTASVYAPLTEVLVEGSGEIYGSMRAGSIYISGHGDLHYDEALGEVKGGGRGSSRTEPAVAILSRR